MPEATEVSEPALLADSAKEEPAACGTEPTAVVSDDVQLTAGRLLFLFVRHRGFEMTMPIDKVCESSSSSPCTQNWPDLDLLDSMELGLTRELVADFERPPPRRPGGRLWEFRVDRSLAKREYRLFAGQEFLMYATVSSEQAQIYLYDPDAESSEERRLYNPTRPVFVLSRGTSPASGTSAGASSGAGEVGDQSVGFGGHPEENWRLARLGCDRCRNSPGRWPCICQGEANEVLTVRHSRQPVGETFSHCMTVSSPAMKQTYITRLPIWNKIVKGLVLPSAFLGGHNVQASAKNFQLTSEERPNSVLCQYGKLGPNRFALDFTYPLTVIQAFAISLTTTAWE